MTTAVIPTTKWNVDKTHSEIQFKVKHMMISTVSGTLQEYDAGIECEGDDFTKARISFTGQVRSITTGSEQRDGHLMTEDFFNPEKFPVLSFQSGLIEKKGEDKYEIHGDLTIRDTTLPVVLQAQFEGMAVDPWGNTKYGFSLSGKINRKQFGLNWNVVTDAGGILVGEEVILQASLQLTKES